MGGDGGMAPPPQIPRKASLRRVWPLHPIVGTTPLQHECSGNLNLEMGEVKDHTHRSSTCCSGTWLCVWNLNSWLKWFCTGLLCKNNVSVLILPVFVKMDIWMGSTNVEMGHEYKKINLNHEIVPYRVWHTFCKQKFLFAVVKPFVSYIIDLKWDSPSVPKVQQFKD